MRPPRAWRLRRIGRLGAHPVSVTVHQFLAQEHELGRGLGTRMVKAFIEALFVDPSVTRIQTDSSPDNARAIRAYEKAGFHRVGEIDTPDGRAFVMHCNRPAGVRR